MGTTVLTWKPILQLKSQVEIVHACREPGSNYCLHHVTSKTVWVIRAIYQCIQWLLSNYYQNNMIFIPMYAEKIFEFFNFMKIH